jgi:hypothetical protein
MVAGATGIAGGAVRPAPATGEATPPAEPAHETVGA